MNLRDRFAFLILEARLAIPSWAWILPLIIFMVQGLRGWPQEQGAERIAELLLPLPFALLVILAWSKERKEGVLEAWICTDLSKAWSLGTRWFALLIWLAIGILALIPKSLWPYGVGVFIACWLLGSAAGLATSLTGELGGLSVALIWWVISLIVVIERLEVLQQFPWDSLWLGLYSLDLTEQSVGIRKAVQLAIGGVCLVLALLHAHRR